MVKIQGNVRIASVSDVVFLRKTGYKGGHPATEPFRASSWGAIAIQPSSRLRTGLHLLALLCARQARPVTVLPLTPVLRVRAPVDFKYLRNRQRTFILLPLSAVITPATRLHQGVQLISPTSTPIFIPLPASAAQTRVAMSNFLSKVSTESKRRLPGKHCVSPLKSRAG